MTPPSAASRPAHANRLIDATSPYLLQHAYNPVDWYPWGAEALDKARREDKPIFLSIGYSACHWCHVMERESFENAAIADLLNKHFVSIKVDREERPDLDEVYMSATVLYNQGQGGWPMSVFLLPDGSPFFAGTYLPLDARWGRPGFKELLIEIARLWEQDRGKITRSAESLTDAIRRYKTLTPSDAAIPQDTVLHVATELARAFDAHTGGLLSGQTNKFPPSVAMSLMLRAYEHTRRQGQPLPLLLDKVELTLQHMARGGIYDHLGGGIARYSTDPQWLVPHFEKMLYDQALVSGIYLEAYQCTSTQEYADVARDIFRYVLTDLRSVEGGFYSSRDADSEGVEGRYYVWSKREIIKVLGDRAGELFCSYYDVTDQGNWEGHNILNVQHDVETVARLNGIAVEELRQTLVDARKELLNIRAQRVPPGLDDKILTSWNGLMIASLARAARVLDDASHAQAASAAADFILTRVTKDGRLLRTYRQGKAHIGGYLDDYAFFIEALLELYEATYEPRWLTEAMRLNEQMLAHFWDDAGGAFFYTADDAESLVVRTKDTHDGATPAGNSVAVMNLLRLAEILERDDLRTKAERAMTALAGDVQNSPFGFDRLLAEVDLYHASITQVVIVGPRDAAGTRALIQAVHRGYDPYRVSLLLDPQSPGADGWRQFSPVFTGKVMVDDRPTAYICRNRTCGPPVTTAEDLAQALSRPAD